MTFASRFSPLSKMLGALALSFLSGSAWAQTLPAGVSQVTTVEGITEYRLDNGLRVLLAPDESKPTTTVNMTYLVGSRQEGPGETGMAHLLEHMMFKGTKTTRNALGEFSKRGLQANGTTSYDRTNYFASFAADPDTLKWYLGWQADAMVNSLIARADLDSEMTVVRNEMESGENNPFRSLMQKMQSVAFQWHNYGKSTIGARSDVENVDIDQLRAFYHTYYQPDNAVLIVAGKFTPDSTLANIAESFGKIPAPKRKLPPEYTVEPAQDGERAITVRRAGGTPLVAAMYHIPEAASPDYIPMELASIIVADTPSGRLYQALVPTGHAAGVFGFAMDLHDPGLVMFGAQLQADMAPEQSLGILTDTLHTLADKPFTQQELDRARSQWLASWDRVYADPEQLGVALSDAIASGDWRLFFLQRDRVRDAKLADVQRVGQAYLVASNVTEGSYIPTDKPVRAPSPPRTDASTLLKDYQGSPDFQQAEAFNPTPDNIDQRTQRKTVTLDHGSLKLALLPKATRGSRAEARLELHFGDVDSLRGQRTVSTAVASLLDRGTQSRSRQQIQDEIDSLGGSVSVGGGGTSVSVAISAPGKNLPTLIALVGDMLRNPTFPEAEFDEYQRASLTSLRSSMSEPQTQASRALARHDNPWEPDDIRYTPSFDESLAAIKALKRDDLAAFHARTYGAGDVSLSVVGDFDAAQVEKATTQALSGWQQGAAYTRVPSPYRDVPAKRFDIETPDKANAFFLSSMPLAMQDDNADFPALYLGNFLFGTSETSRLWNRVREKDGLSYNVRSSLSVSSYEPSGSWSIYAIYAPENRERLEGAINEEIQRVLKDGFSDAEVADGIKALLNYRRLARAQDDVLASAWSGYLDLGRSFAWSAQMDQQLQTLTADDVNRVMRQYLKPEHFSTAVAGDFARATANAK